MPARRTPPDPARRADRRQAQVVAAAKQRSGSDARAAQDKIDEATIQIGDVGNRYGGLEERVRNIEEQLQ